MRPAFYPSRLPVRLTRKLCSLGYHVLGSRARDVSRNPKLFVKDALSDGGPFIYTVSDLTERTRLIDFFVDRGVQGNSRTTFWETSTTFIAHRLREILIGRGRDTGYPMPLHRSARAALLTAYGSCLRS